MNPQLEGGEIGQMEVNKLGPQHRESEWVDAEGRRWRYTEAAAWQWQQGERWCGSYWTVEGAPPYRQAPNSRSSKVVTAC